MAITMTLKGGEKDFDLIWDSTETVPLATLPASITEESRPRPMWHVPGGDDGSELIDLTYDDARWPLIVQLGAASDWSTLLEELAILRRVFRQAQAHAMGEPWADEVYVECEPDGSASSTYYTVKMVEDRSGGYLAGTQVAQVMFDSLAITMTVAGDGYGDEETLDNAIQNGHMLIESAVAGQAANVTAQGTPTLTLDTTNKLIGAQSQKVVTDNSTTEGVYMAVTAAISTLAVAYVWIYHAGGDDLTVALTDGAGGNVHVKTLQVADAGGVSDKSVLDSEGNTWYRVSVTGTNSAAANFRVYVYRMVGDATQITTYYVDGFYLETGTSTAPNAWAGFPQVYNRDDPVAANPERVDRLDVWGIPGDRPAWFELTCDTNTIEELAKAYVALNKQAAVADTHLLEIEDVGGGTADAYCSGGEFLRFTGAFSATLSLDPTKYNDVYHILLRMRSSDYTESIATIMNIGRGNTTIKSGISNANGNEWDLLYGGIVDLRTSDYWRSDLPSAGDDLVLGCVVVAISGNIDVDYLLLLPARERQLIICAPELSLNNSVEKIYLVGREKVFLAASTTNPERMEFLGELWELEPGRMNRLVFAFIHDAVNNGGGDSDKCHIVYDSELTLKYRPRTRGFLA
jgi:hypothetical protein